MKDIVCYIKLPNHVRQWLEHSFGNPVRFPLHSYENAVMLRLLQVRPKNVPVRLRQEGDAVIVIPDNPYRNPLYYNYIGRRGVNELTCMITELFSMNLWSDLIGYVHNVRGINAIINEWCRDHGIDVIYREAVRQRFYRMRKNKEKLGVNLGKSYLNKKRQGSGLCPKKYKTSVSLYDVMKDNDTFEERQTNI